MVLDLYSTKRSLELKWQLEYEQSGKYTLNMVEIDEKIKSIITEIKTEEFNLAEKNVVIDDSVKMYLREIGTVKLLSAEQMARYEEILEKVRSGEITIPDETVGDYPIGTIGSGAAVDLAAIGCI